MPVLPEVSIVLVLVGKVEVLGLVGLPSCSWLELMSRAQWSGSKSRLRENLRLNVGDVQVGRED